MTELDNVVHNLTGRRFRNTSKMSAYQQGSSYGNSFYNPRNIGNFDEGQIAPEGSYATHYPVNSASNTMGFTLLDDEGDDKRLYYPSTISSNANALRDPVSMAGGALGAASSGSASDYLYFNPYYEALLNPQSHKTMEEVAQPHYIPHTYDDKIEGRGTNAPSSASAVDFAMNNPYAFKSNFNNFTGGALGAASSGSASDYYDSNPNRVPAMQNETRHYGEFMMQGGAIDWAKYLGYIRKGAQKIPAIIDEAPAYLKKASDTLDTVKKLRDLLRGKEEGEQMESRVELKSKSKRKPKQKKHYKK